MSIEKMKAYDTGHIPYIQEKNKNEAFYNVIENSGAEEELFDLKTIGRFDNDMSIEIKTPLIGKYANEGDITLVSSHGFPDETRYIFPEKIYEDTIEVEIFGGNYLEPAEYEQYTPEDELKQVKDLHQKISNQLILDQNDLSIGNAIVMDKESFDKLIGKNENITVDNDTLHVKGKAEVLNIYDDTKEEIILFESKQNQENLLNIIENAYNGLNIKKSYEFNL